MSLISEAYREEQQELHKNPNYGVASVSFAPYVTQIINSVQPKTMLDYGAGKGRLLESIKPSIELDVQLYDPAIEEYSKKPNEAELVTCIDVLEHIEPDLLDNVLDDLKRVTIGHGFFTIHTGPAMKVLSDGRNAHLIQEDYTWWMPKLWERFNIHQMTHVSNGFFVIVRAKEWL